MTDWLRYQNIECVPVIHGRLAFAIEVRRRLLARRYDAVAIELPPTLAAAVEEALELLPRVTFVTYCDQPRFLAGHGSSEFAGAGDSPVTYYVPIQPADGMIEALRIAIGERLPRYFVDADVDDFDSARTTLPDPQCLHTIGVGQYFEQCLPLLARHPHSDLDACREGHMAARLRELQREHRGPILFVCGLAHWSHIRRHLEAGTGALHAGRGVAEELTIYLADGRSVPHLVGEIPYLAAAYEKHRSGWDLHDFDATDGLKSLLFAARDAYLEYFPDSVSPIGLQALRTTLDFARRMTVRRGFLIPDTYTLTVAANGVIGNDFALVLLETAQSYPWNPHEDGGGWVFGSGHSAGAAGPEPGAVGPNTGSARHDSTDPRDDADGSTRYPHGAIAGSRADLDGYETVVRSRAPGTDFTYGRLRLERRPDLRRRRQYEVQWDPHRQCSWPPEDLVIENFRDYVGRRALSLAKVAVARSEPFTTSYLDGLDLRASLRDVVERRVFVREEPRTPGGVGALVMVFEEDDFGERYPWRSTWMAENHNESTLAFYATDFMQDILGPGVARARYGGCMLIFPPIGIPDVWGDLRFERARTPSERLLLAAIYWAQDHFVVHVGGRPPSDGVKAEARRRSKHILHLPLTTFSSSTLERLRRVHVLNGQEVRSWAKWFIR
ncbi:MAG: hypothetical protein AB7O52_08035 [Planctomycetota bacterium]